MQRHFWYRKSRRFPCSPNQARAPVHTWRLKSLAGSKAFRCVKPTRLNVPPLPFFPLGSFISRPFRCEGMAYEKTVPVHIIYYSDERHFALGLNEQHAVVRGTYEEIKPLEDYVAALYNAHATDTIEPTLVFKNNVLGPMRAFAELIALHLEDIVQRHRDERMAAASQAGPKLVTSRR